MDISNRNRLSVSFTPASFIVSWTPNLGFSITHKAAEYSHARSKAQAKPGLSRPLAPQAADYGNIPEAHPIAVPIMYPVAKAPAT
jgi:hypothetical protein